MKENAPFKRGKKWKAKPCDDGVDLKYSGQGRAKSQRKTGVSHPSCAPSRGSQAGSNRLVGSALMFLAISSNDNRN